MRSRIRGEGEPSAILPEAFSTEILGVFPMEAKKGDRRRRESPLLQKGDRWGR